MTSLGTAHARIEAQDKVGGTAHYTADRVPPGQQVVHCVHVGAQINVGRVTGVDDGAAMQMPGVLGVMWHGNAPRLGESEDAELHVLQGPDVHYRGQIVAAVIAISVEQARAAAESLDIDYERAEGFDNVLHATHRLVTRPTRSMRDSLPRHAAGIPRQPSQMPTMWSTTGTPPPRCTTHRWSRTPPLRPGNRPTTDRP